MLGLFSSWRAATGLITGAAATTAVFQAPAVVSTTVCEVRHVIGRSAETPAEALQAPAGQADADIDPAKLELDERSKCGLTQADATLHDRQKLILEQITHILERLKGAGAAS